MRIKRGIILIATGHPYYGRMAYNLACTIKASEDVPIAVVYSGAGLSHLSMQQLNIFDQVIPLPEAIGPGFAPKLYLNELSPFDETIFFDADMLWLPKRKPSELFDELAPHDYTGITEGWHDLDHQEQKHVNQAYYFWADIVEISKVYGIKSGKIYQWRSEVIYFKKNELTDRFFKTAQQIHDNPGLESIRRFGTYVPDELAINISAAIHGIHPHKTNWTPAYWHKLNRDIIPEPSSLHQWYLMSFGSNFASGSLKKIYDQIAKAAFIKLKRQHMFSLHSKKGYLPERVKM